MKRLWSAINNMKIKRGAKNKLYVGALILINIVIGGVIWLTFGRIIMPGKDWLLCFMGYPAIICGFFGGTLYLYNHEFA